MYSLSAILVALSLFFTVFGKEVLAAETPKIDFHFYESHTIKLLEEGVASLEGQLQVIRNAEKSIDIEKFIINKDVSARLIIRELIAKKKSNPHIKIRIILDATPYHETLTWFHAKELQRYGIEFKLYNQFGFWNLNMRDHRKILASEKEAIIGGRNIGNDYFDLSHEFNFIDRDVLVRGPILKAIAWSFDVFWFSKETKFPNEVPFPNINDYRLSDHKTAYEQSVPDAEDEVRKFKNEVDAFTRKTSEAEKFVSSELTDDELKILSSINMKGQIALDKQPEFKINNIRFVSDGPDWDQTNTTVTGPAIIELMVNSKEYLLIENGYIIPDQETWKIYEQHLASGKQLSILTNSRRAAKREFLVNAMTLNHMKKLITLGADVFLFTGGFAGGTEEPFPETTSSARFNTHAKTMIVDKQTCIIGTANFDPRSLKRLNAELGLIIEDQSFCGHLQTMVELRARNGAEMTAEGHAKNKININRAESFSQRLQLFLLPAVQLFEKQF